MFVAVTGSNMRKFKEFAGRKLLVKEILISRRRKLRKKKENIIG